MHGRHCCHSCGSFIQHNSVIFTERLLSSRYIAKRNLDPVSSSIILPSALTDLLIKKKWVFIYILSNHLPIKGSSEKYPLEMRNREERRENEPGKCASWNVGAICPEMPISQEACTTWHPKEGECGLGYGCCYLPWPQKYLELILSNFKIKIFF